MSSVCIPNIGRKERLRRQRIGLVSLAATAIAVVLLLALDTPRVWRVLVFLPLIVATLSLFQVRAKTCVALAARGMRNMDEGNEAIADPAELQAVKAQARRVNLQASIAAAAITAVLVALP
jgi:hypothetical protein